MQKTPVEHHDFYSYSDAGASDGGEGAEHAEAAKLLQPVLDAYTYSAESEAESSSNYSYFTENDDVVPAETSSTSVSSTSSPHVESKQVAMVAASPNTDWNLGFKIIIAMPDSPQKFKALSQLAKDFVHCAKLYAKLIISELYLPDSEKTLKPIDVGGVAGGSKYIAQGILFKFALDKHDMYGGDANAMKAAGHELKGLMCFYNCHIPKLHVPLMALIDYRGFRVVAVSLLPVGKDTIIYGSSDGGYNVHAKNPEFNKLMKMAGRALNLKAHTAGKEQTVVIYGPADIEGHLSPTDGCFYLLDFARTMPPQVALTKERSRRHLYELLRPELVKSNPLPLSSDSLTGMGKSDPLRVVHNDEVKEACHRLFKDIIPQFVKDYEANKSQTTLITPEEANLVSSGERLTTPTIKMDELIQSVHRAGINIRHLGLVRSKASKSQLRKELLQEMIARVMKDEVYAQLRKTMSQLHLPADEPYRTVVIEEIKKLLMDKFMMALSKEEQDESFQLLKLLDVQELILRFSALTGINLKTDAIPVLDGGISKIVDTDLLELEAKAKKMNVVSEAAAMVLSWEAQQRKGSEASRLFQIAIDTFKEAISSSPNSHFAFFQFGKMLHDIALRFSFGDDSISLMASAIDKLEKAIAIDANHSATSTELADTLLDFATNPRRLWLLYRKESKELMHGVNAIIEKAARHLKKALRPKDLQLSDEMSLLSQAEREKLAATNRTAIEDLIAKASDIKLIAFTEASLKCKTLASLLERVLSKRSVLKAAKEGILCFKRETILRCIELSKGSLEVVILNHAQQIDEPTLASIFKLLPKLTQLKVHGLESVKSTLSLPALPTLKRLSFAGTGLFTHMSEKELDHLIALFPNVETLTLSGTAVTDLQLTKFLAKLPKLRVVKLGRFTDPLKNVSSCRAIDSPTMKCEALETLDLSGCMNVKNATLVTLAKYARNLTSLNFSSCAIINDEALNALSKKVTSLTSLCLASTAVTDAGVKSIVQANTKLTDLNLELCENLRGTCIRKIFESCKLLKRLELSYWKFDLVDPIVNWKTLSDGSVASVLASAPNLTRINFAGSYALTDASLHLIATTIGPKLVSLGLARCPLISDDGLREVLVAAPNLAQLVLDSCTDLTEVSIKVIANYSKKIQELSLCNINKIFNQDIQYLLHRITTLRSLNLQGCKSITAQFLFRELRHQCPLLHIFTLNNMKLKGFAI